MVDGNEIGRAIEIFVRSRDPESAITLCRPMLEQKGLIDTIIVVHGPTAAGPFDVIGNMQSTLKTSETLLWRFWASPLATPVWLISLLML